MVEGLRSMVIATGSPNKHLEIKLDIKPNQIQ